MMGLRERSLPSVDGALGSKPVHPHLAEWLCPRPGRDGSAVRCSPMLRLSGSSSGSVEQLSRFQHRMHDDRELTGDGDCCAFEADPFFEF